VKFGTFLLALVEPMLAKILLALGFSVVSIVGVEAALGQIKALITAYIQGAGPIIDFALYLWIGKAMGIIFGACTTKMMLWQVQNATKILGKAP
jgi:hypothetical protein